MRSADEIRFRLRQELTNALLQFAPVSQNLRAEAPLALLPDPQAVADAVRDSSYAAELVRLADQILQGRIPIFGTEIDYGREPAWRRDPWSGAETPQHYFRRVPYLDYRTSGDHKWIWELNRHQHLVLLAQAFVLTGRAAYHDEILRQLEHWWRENRFQRGINWTSALEVGFRALSWIWIWHLTGNTMPPRFRQRFLAEFHRHGLHLEYNLSIYFSPNTHLLGEAVALHAIGRLFPQLPRAERWRVLGRNTVREQMQRQVKRDGSHFEQSTYYHVYALDFFLLHAVLEETTAEYRDRLSRMAGFLTAVVQPRGELPFLGDDDGGRVFHPYGARSGFARDTLATASRVLGNPAFPCEQRDMVNVALWWLGPDKCSPFPPVTLEAYSHAFADSGLVSLQREGVAALFDAGPFGPWSAGHSHADSLSLVVSSAAGEILIDPGTYTYMDPEWRDVFRGTAAHNTVRIDGHNQARPAGPFGWTAKPEVRLLAFSTTADEDHALGICRYSGFTHKRSIRFRGGRIFDILDELDGPSGEHLVEQFWHLAAAPAQIGEGLWRIGDLAELQLEGGELETGWRSRVFGVKEQSWVLVVRRKTALPLSLRARLTVIG